MNGEIWVPPPSNVFWTVLNKQTYHAALQGINVSISWESVRLIPRDLGHCPRRQSRRGQWARSQGINPDSHTNRVDNSGSATTVLATKNLYNDAKSLFLSERWVFFLKCQPSLLFWWRDTNRPITIKKMGLLPCQLVVVSHLAPYAPPVVLLMKYL